MKIDEIDKRLPSVLIVALLILGVYLKLKSGSLDSTATAISLSSLYNCDYGTDFAASNYCVSDYVERAAKVYKKADLYKNASYLLLASSIGFSVLAFRKKLLFFQK
jgi:hypothetical protein